MHAPTRRQVQLGGILMAATLALPPIAAQPSAQQGPASPQGSFDEAVLPILKNTCAGCHNERLASGGLNLVALERADSVATNREEWEAVLRKLRAGEMPPAGRPRPDGLTAALTTMASYIDREFETLDRNTAPDPGRVTARHLNRTEYRNTIRDLLGVDFQTAQEFPVDDSGDGFDNIGDVLTVSPLLAEKYLAAAERISARALGLVKLPAKPISDSYADDENYTEGAPFTGTSGAAHRAGNNFIEVVHRVEYDGDYTIIAGLAGQRGPEGKPVTMGFWMDGVLLHSEGVLTTPTRTVYFGSYEKREFRVFLPEGRHTFRLGFINDEVGAALTKSAAVNPRSNKYPQLIGFLGPERAAQEPAGRKKILVCDPASGQACVERILAEFAHRAYRRPVTPAEVASLARLVATARKDGLNPEEAIQTAVEAILVSPNFLFRIEHDPGRSVIQGKPAPSPSGVHRISDIELASRLSYFLWSSMPDDELLKLAEAGTLSRPDVLDAQTTRMLADPRSASLGENFAGQWLEIRNLDAIRPDPDKFPEWSVELKDAMRTETSLFFNSVLRENRPISEFLNARYTFLNETLAKFYGIEGVTGPDFRRVELATSQRGGILGHASVLAVSSYPTRTSVVLRGKYILDNILGSPPPPPPANVPVLDEAAVGTLLSLRKQMESHRANPTCAVCHSKMDPLGFALENYDAIGRWRTLDGKFPVDSTGMLPDGTKFDGPAEMREALSARLPQLAQSLIEKMMIYALGRGVGANDRRTVRAINREWEAKGYRFQSLLFAVVHSLPFGSARSEAAATQVAQVREVLR